MADTPAQPKRPAVASDAGSPFLSANYSLNYKAAGDSVRLSNSIVTPAKLDEIFKELDIDCTTAKAADLAFALAMACKDQGSSGYAEIAGDYAGYPLKNAVAIVKKSCTLRQFCMFYAPAVWNHMVYYEEAPANWLRKGFDDRTKYAAFDFFNGVTHPQAVRLPNGLQRLPTADESRAAQLNGTIAISSSRAFNTYSTRAEVASHEQVGNSSTTRPAITW